MKKKVRARTHSELLDLQLVDDVGYLDLRGVGENGHGNMTQLHIGSKELRTTMALRLGLTLPRPRTFCSLIQEIGTLKKKSISIQRDLLKEDNLVHSEFYENQDRTKMDWSFHIFAEELKALWQAKALIYTFSYDKPDYVEILVIIRRRKLDFPVLLITQAVELLNERLKIRKEEVRQKRLEQLRH